MAMFRFYAHVLYNRAFSQPSLHLVGTLFSFCVAHDIDFKTSFVSTYLIMFQNVMF